MPLYHFTDGRNVPSIRRYGLLSWQLLVGRGIQHFPASNELSRELDARKDLQNYVRLCLRPQHPMATRALYERRVESLVWLEIDDVVTRWRATRFSDRNATANEARVDSSPATAFSSQDPQAEILVEGSLNPKWITFPAAGAPCTEPDRDSIPF